MGASVTPQTPPNTITFTPGGTVVINGSAIGGNNAVSIQIQNKEICYIDSSGNLNTASGSAFITSIAAPAAASANGLSVSGTALSATPADGTHPGIVTTGSQTFAGVKTFSSAITASAGVNSDSIQGITSANFTLGNSVYIGMLHLGVATPAVGNYVLFGDGTNNYLNCPYGGAIVFRSGNEGVAWLGAVGATYIFDLTAQGLNTSPTKIRISFTDLSGTPGAGTANTATGLFAVVASSASTFKITNAAVEAGSVIIATPQTSDETCIGVACIPTTGGFNVTPLGAAAPTGNQVYQFVVFN